jgi:hypothetical protein
VAWVVAYTPLQPPQRTRVEGEGRMLSHVCEDVNGDRHRQRLPLGSVRGIMYVDALCLHCGAHLVWVADDQLLPAGLGEGGIED